MCSGVRKSGWPMPRLMMSRPCAASALARASTANAFSSPMRSNAAMVFSMDFPRFGLVHGCAAAPAAASTGPFPAADLQFGHAHDLEDDGNRPPDQQQTIERGDRSDQT